MLDNLGEDGLRAWRERTGRKGGTSPKTKPFGFQVMDKQRLSEVGSKGGTERARRRKEEV